MPWIRTVADDQAEGSLKKMFDAAIQRAGHVFNILRVMSLNPDTLRSSMSMYRATMFSESPLTRAQRELLATVVSRDNHCFY